MKENSTEMNQGSLCLVFPSWLHVTFITSFVSFRDRSKKTARRKGPGRLSPMSDGDQGLVIFTFIVLDSLVIV